MRSIDAQMTILLMEIIQMPLEVNFIELINQRVKLAALNQKLCKFRNTSMQLEKRVSFRKAIMKNQNSSNEDS